MEKDFKTYQFNPANDKLPRLKAEAGKYARYKISYMNIAYISASSTNTTGAIKFGVAPGTVLANIDASSILKLRPAEMLPVWKNGSITLGNTIDTSRFMYCDDTSRDGVSFTLYVNCATPDVGAIKISYRVELAYPHP